MNEYFKKNLAVMTGIEQELIASKKVLVAGCGGLGGSVIEILCRSGFKYLTVVDGDVFSPSNMNRQLLCTRETMGTSKAEAAAERAALISSDINVHIVNSYMTEDNISNMISGHDLVIDALDNIETRLLLEDACEAGNIPIVHGAVNGWQMQVAVCMPGSHILHRIYANKTDLRDGSGRVASSGGIAMTVFTCAAFEVSEAVKFILNRENILADQLLMFDLLDKESMVMNITE